MIFGKRRVRQEPVLLQDGPVRCCVCPAEAFHSVDWCGHGSSDFAHVMDCPFHEQHLLCLAHMEALSAKVRRSGHGKSLWRGSPTRRVDFQSDGYKRWPCESGCRFGETGELPSELTSAGGR